MSDGQVMISSLKTAIECQFRESCNWLIIPTNVSSLIGFDAQMRLFKIHAKKYPPARVKVHGPSSFSDSILDTLADALIALEFTAKSENQ